MVQSQLQKIHRLESLLLNVTFQSRKHADGDVVGRENLSMHV